MQQLRQGSGRGCLVLLLLTLTRPGAPLLLQGPGRPAASALAAWLPELDGKAANLSEKAWRFGECEAIAQKICADAAPRQRLQALHTGAFLRDFEQHRDAAVAARKLRLEVLSFLTTQDLARTKLHIWTDVGLDEPSGVLKGALEPILSLPGLAKSVQVRRFDARREFGKVSQESGELLWQMYTAEDRQPASRSDLQRIAVLYNYGGAWLDTDVILIQDMTPLMGVDWAYLGQTDLINNALLSVSKPRSLFATAYISALVAQNVTPGPDTGYFRHGPKILDALFKEEWTRRSFHVLPTCFFDGGWSAEKDSPPWRFFFGRPVEGHPEELDYLYPGNDQRTAFAYHWHGHWDEPIANGSLAYALERIYLWKLGLKGP